MILIFDINRRYAIYYLGLKKEKKPMIVRGRKSKRTQKKLVKISRLESTRLTLWRTLACTKLSSLREQSVDRSH